MQVGRNPWQCNRKIYLLLALVALMGCLVLPRLLVNAEQITTHMLFNWRGPKAPPPEITLVSLNLQAAESLGQSRQYFSRSVHAQLINQLSEAGAGLIVFDVAFKNARSEEEDASLEAAIQSSDRIVLFDYLKRYQVDTNQQGSDAGGVDVEEIIPPLPRFAQAARGEGHFVLPKAEAYVGHFYPVLELQGRPRLSQPLVALSLFAPDQWQQFQHNLKQVASEWETHGPIWTHINQFTNQQKNDFLALCQDPLCKALWHCFTHPDGVFINFYGPPGHLPQWPIDQVLAMQPAERGQFFAGKIVYVGLVENQQTEQQDAYKTVFSKANGLDLSGVEISATVLGNILHGQVLKHLSFLQQSALLAFWLMAVSLAALTLPSRVSWSFGVISLICYGVAAYWMFVQRYFVLPLAGPIALSVLFYSLDISLCLRANRLRYQNLLTDLSNYMPQQAAKALSEQISNFAEHNQVVSGVCLLTDIQGYTRLAEELPPAQLHELMNTYYAELIDEVKASGGIVGNIVGDALLALWLDNHVSIDACLRASRTACAIQKRLAAHADLQQLPTSCALHGGEFSLGHLGASGHFEYSPVGDMVNTVSRMEPFNRQLGTRIICSNVVGEVMAKFPSEFKLRDLGAFSLRNKKTAVSFYQLYEPGINPLQNALESQFKQALECFAQAPHNALILFEALAEQFPEDGPCRYYLHQCRQALKNAAQ